MKTREASAVGEPETSDRMFKAGVRQMWALGDYHRFAKQTVWDLGRVLVEECGVSPGHRVLDVAAGTGNTAIRAAEAGARVVASDLTPENFDSGRREAHEVGVEVEWREADAEALPFEDASFDIVASSFGAIFAPDHQAVADEMVRVCRPGGTIGTLNFKPKGLAADFFELLGRYAPPPPPHAGSPLDWGREEHVRGMLGDRVESVEATEGTYVEQITGGPVAYCDLFRTTFGPVIAIRTGLESDPDAAASFDRDFLAFATGGNHGAPGGPAEYPYPYLLVVARVAR